MRSYHARLAVLSLGAILPVLLGSEGGCHPPLPDLAAETASPEEGLAGRAGPGEDPGRLKLLITDKPFPFEYIEQALITVTRVEVRRAGGASGGVDGPFLVFEQEEGRSFDLVALRNGRADVLAGADLPPGRYTQVRLIVSGGEVRLRDGRLFPFRSSGGEEAGIRVECDFQVRAGCETAMLLDVDLSRAFSPVPAGAVTDPGQIREFRFSPAAAMRLVELDATGSLSGTVRDANGFPIPDVAVTAYSNGVDVTSGATEGDGTFLLIGLPAGEYALEFSADGYIQTRREPITVSAGQVTNVADVNLESTPGRYAAGPLLLPASLPGEAGDVNYALHATVTLYNRFFSTQYHTGPESDPQTVTDGIFLPRRTVWDQGTVWWTWVAGFNSGQYLEIDLGQPCRIESFVVQTYSKESYVLSYWDLEEEVWKIAWNVPKGDIYATGMETRPDPLDNTVRYVLPSPIVTGRLKFAGAATSGMHLYAVSEIQAWGRPLNSSPVAAAGGPYAAAATSWDGAVLTLDGSASADPDGDELSYSWRSGDQEIGTAPTFSGIFPIGESVVSLTITDPAGLTATAEAVVTVTVTEVAVDIKPGDDANTVNPTSRAALPTAFLSDANFDAASINPATISVTGYGFGGFVRVTGNGKLQAVLEDVDGDGDLDLLVHLDTAALPLDGTETTCTLGALTWDGYLVRGTDRIRIVGPSKGK